MIVEFLCYKLVCRARARAPQEIGGFLGRCSPQAWFTCGAEIENVEREAPASGFTFEADTVAACLRHLYQLGCRDFVFWHSHPSSPPLPSPADRALMVETGMLAQVIVSARPHAPKLVLYGWEGPRLVQCWTWHPPKGWCN